jgi:hypothetical protein
MHGRPRQYDDGRDTAGNPWPQPACSRRLSTSSPKVTPSSSSDAAVNTLSLSPARHGETWPTPPPLITGGVGAIRPNEASPSASLTCGPRYPTGIDETEKSIRPAGRVPYDVPRARPSQTHQTDFRDRGQTTTRGGPEYGRGRPGATSLGRCGQPLASGERNVARSVLALPDRDNLVDGEVSVLESERAGCEVEQPRTCSGWGDELLCLLP